MIKSWIPSDGYDKWVEVVSKIETAGTSLRIRFVVTGMVDLDRIFVDDLSMHLFNDADEIRIHAMRTNASEEEKLTEEIIYKLDTDCCGKKRVYFKNNLGSYESIMINANLQSELNVERQEIIENLPCMYDIEDAEITSKVLSYENSIFGTTEKKYTEKNKEILSQFLYSSKHYIFENDKFVPIYLFPESFVTLRNKNVIEVRFRYKYAWINFTN